MNDAGLGFNFERGDAFSDCQSLSEVVIVADALGLDVAQLLASAQPSRQALQAATAQFRQLGLTDLASACARQARRAVPRPPSAREKHEAWMAQKVSK
jgi:HrpA-like RNA helicase